MCRFDMIDLVLLRFGCLDILLYVLLFDVLGCVLIMKILVWKVLIVFDVDVGVIGVSN